MYKRTKVTKCKYCNEDIDSEHLKKHYDYCDENPKGKHYGKKEKIQGIGGWLIFPTLGFAVSALMIIYSILIFIPILGEGEIILYFVIYLAYAIILVYTLYLEFKLSKSFPTWAIFSLWGGVVFIFILSVTDGNYSDLGGALIGSIIWHIYFNSSKRVKNTFVK